jgi:cell shape-determining protein MreC
MTSLLDLQNKILNLESYYEKGQLTKEEYLELLNDLDTSKVITETAQDLEDLAKLNSIISNTITVLSAVA